MEQLNLNRQQTIANFEKFCAFITSEHDIEVVTSINFQPLTNGKQIYVPDISGLTPKQVYFVYSSVLHEVGHILHTDFSREYFEQLFNFLISSIANILEDCREESLLCDKFAGAKEIFETTGTWMISQDKEILQMYARREEIEKMDNEAIGFFELFCNWLYTFAHRTVHIDEQHFSIYGEKYGELCKFLKKTDFRNRFNNLKNSLYCQDDVLIFSEQIYNLLVQEFPEKSQNYQFHKLENFFKTKQIALEYFSHTKKEVMDSVETLQKGEIEILEMEVNALTLKKSIVLANQESETKITELVREISDKNKKIISIQNFIAVKEQPDTQEDTITSSLENISENKAKIRELESRQKEANKELTQMKKALAEIQVTPKNEKKIEKLQARIERKLVAIEKLESREKKVDNSISRLNKRRENAENAQQKKANSKKAIIKQNKSLKNLSSEEIKEIIDGINREIEPLQTALNALYKTQNEYMAPHNKAMAEIQMKRIKLYLIQNSCSNILYEDGTKINMILQTNAIFKSVFPSLSLSMEWPSMRQFQQEQDQQFMSEGQSIVLDGCNFCPDLDSCQWMLEHMEEVINKIDPLIEFKKQYQTCLKDLMHCAQIDEVLLLCDNDDNVQSIVHKADTSFDETNFETKVKTKDKIKFEQLCHENEEKIEYIVEIFENNFKPKRKDRWMGNQESGQLDTRALWQMPAGINDRIFEQNFTEIQQNVNATILVDLSSSNYHNPNAEKDIQLLVKGLSDALSYVDISHEILGHYAEVSPEMIRLKKSSQTNRRFHQLKTTVFKSFGDDDNNGIANIKLKVSDNSDGESLKIALKRLSSQPEDKHIVFLVSDFMPHLLKANTTLLEKDFSKAIESAEKNRTKIYGFNPTMYDGGQVPFSYTNIEGLSTKSIQNLEQSEFFDFIATIQS